MLLYPTKLPEFQCITQEAPALSFWLLFLQDKRCFDLDLPLMMYWWHFGAGGWRIKNHVKVERSLNKTIPIISTRLMPLIQRSGRHTSEETLYRRAYH
jgi:hypothetical protein